MIIGLFLTVLVFVPQVVLSADWPLPPAPESAKVEMIGMQVRLNGVPMRMQRVLSRQGPKELLQHYRAALGPRHAYEYLVDRHILSQGRGEHFITVSIRPLARDISEALVSVADAREARQAAGRPLGFRLPAGSTLLADMESVDAGRRARQLVLTNRHTIDANVSAFARDLARRGLRPDGNPLHASANKHAQLFRGEGREALLTLVRRGDETSIVLNLIDTP